MTASEQIKEICDKIAREFSPEKIIVFGSHAHGNPGPFFRTWTCWLLCRTRVARSNKPLAS